MKMTKLTKLSLALAIICAVICCIAIAPLIVLAILAFVALVCLLICLLIYFFGAILWLFSGSKVNLFPAGSDVFDFAISLFTYTKPVARISFLYITPYAGFVAIAAGVSGVIISAVALSRARREPKQEQAQDFAKSQQALNSSSEGFVSASDNPAELPPDNGRGGGIFDPYSVYNAEGKAVREKEEKGKKNKKPRVKKAKTLKGVCISSLIVCIVFTVVAVIAIIVAYVFEGIFV